MDDSYSKLITNTLRGHDLSCVLARRWQKRIDERRRKKRDAVSTEPPALVARCVKKNSFNRKLFRSNSAASVLPSQNV